MLNSTPSYLSMGIETLKLRAGQARGLLSPCSLCPRACGADRTGGETGFCGIGDKPVVASCGPHFGEESTLVGRGGSGTIFLAGCNLGCVFCQNWTISQSFNEAETTPEALSAMMTELQDMGCHNINLVTPTHQMPMILEALAIASERGLMLPLVWNCGGYESVESLKLLDGIVDIYMPDLKYTDPARSGKYSDAPDYPERAKEAIREMHRQVGDLVMDKKGVAKRGLLVRHLVMPGGVAGTKEAVRFLAEEISKDTYINVMDQYRPCHHAGRFPEINRRITDKEYAEAVSLARGAGLRRLDRGECA